MTAVIEAASAGVKDMADGSLRITFEFEPRFAAEAFALFGPRGRAVAVAALKDGAGAVVEAINPGRELAPEPGKEAKEPRGDLCFRAVMWCKDPEFWKFLNSQGRDNGGYVDVENESEAEQLIKWVCRIDSRKELDAEPAKAIFLREFVGPYHRWNIARGNT